MEEIWKELDGYNGFYTISSFGRVKNKYGRFLTPSVNHKGYALIHLKDRVAQVHRLVAETFIPNDDKTLQVNHKDENKLNNCVDNLEWCSPKENANYGTRNARIGSKMAGSKRIGRRVVQLTLDGDFVNIFDTGAAAAREMGCSRSKINECIRGEQYTCKGFCWCSIEEYEKYFKANTD